MILRKFELVTGPFDRFVKMTHGQSGTWVEPMRQREQANQKRSPQILSHKMRGFGAVGLALLVAGRLVIAATARASRLSLWPEAPTRAESVELPALRRLSEMSTRISTIRV
jgi:hypothetical protein